MQEGKAEPAEFVEHARALRKEVSDGGLHPREANTRPAQRHLLP